MKYLFPMTIYNVFEQIPYEELYDVPLYLFEWYYRIYTATEGGTNFRQYEQDRKFRQDADNFLIQMNKMSHSDEFDEELNGPKKRASSKTRQRKGAVTLRINNRKDIAEMRAGLKDAASPLLVERYSDDVMILRKCIELVFTKPTRAELRTFINSIRRYLLTQRVNRNSKARTRVMEIQAKLIDEYSRLPNDRATAEFTLSAQTLNEYIALEVSQKIRPSVRLLKRFISLGGRHKVQQQAADLLISMENAVNRGVITRADTYYNEILDAISEIQQYVSSGLEPFRLTPGALHGLDGLCNDDDYSVNGFDGIDDY